MEERGRSLGSHHEQSIAGKSPQKPIEEDCKDHELLILYRLETDSMNSFVFYTNMETYLIPTTTLKSSSNDLFMYFWKLNLLPGAK